MTACFVLGYQTCIPIFASFFPTVISWYAPIFGFNIGWWNTNVPTVALSAFPCIDPLAVILLVPNYRNALLRKKGNSTDCNTSGNIILPKNNNAVAPRVQVLY
uniref:Serpentine receptor class gamma n=1 Tax=Caenorhabditis tropicalis TaxID=1561998 RepID=A0A1I7TYH6_9PELO